MKRTCKFSLIERYTIEGMHRDQYSIYKIARILNRSQDSISKYISKHFISKEQLLKKADGKEEEEEMPFGAVNKSRLYPSEIFQSKQEPVIKIGE